MRVTIFIALFAVLISTGCQGTGEVASNNGSASTSGGGDAVSNGNNSGDAETADMGESDSNESNSHSKFQTIYTDLAENKCEDVDSDEQEAWSVQSCKGVGGYSLNVSEGDLRQTVDVITSDEKKFELDLWTIVSSGFSTVGDKAEWRVVKENGKIRPVALIVRYNVSENPENAEKVTSYLTVSKITPGAACVTDIVKPVANANEKARQLADESGSKPCLKSKR